MDDKPDSRSQRVRLDFRSGGWVILLAVGLMLLFLGRSLYLLREHGSNPYTRPMQSIEEYGFDLSTCLVPRDLIVPAAPRDLLQPLDAPAMVPAAEIPAINKRYNKYLLPGDRVIGIVIAHQARAYPLRVLTWHEVCNDTVADVPLAVTYNPLCDSAVVFDRRVGGEELHLAPSGLLYNSNLLMYDRRPDHKGESLWSQLLFRAVAGPAARQRQTLHVLPMQIVYWRDWQTQHPRTLVVEPARQNVDRYRREPYGSYNGSQQLRYPVRPLPPTDTWPYKTDVLVVGSLDRPGVYAMPQISMQADPQGHWQPPSQNQDEPHPPVHFDYREIPPNPPTALAYTPDGAPATLVHAWWFAWYAMHPRPGM